jgi:hypothetical protein
VAVTPRLALPAGLALVTAGPRPARETGGYPTDGLQKGLLLLDGEQELSGEGVGFGVPVLKRGLRAAFCGSSKATTRDAEAASLTLVYRVDRLERLGSHAHGRLAPAPLDLARESLSLVYRRVPSLRRPLAAASNTGRRLLGVSTRFEETDLLAEVAVTYALVAARGEHEGVLTVTARLDALPPTVTEVILMNELGATFFDTYEEDGQVTRGGDIGAWDQVTAESARFRSSATGAWFELRSTPDPAAPDARLFRGRELAPGRLAWAGFGYSLRPGPAGFTYTVRFGRDVAAGRGARRDHGAAG